MLKVEKLNKSYTNGVNTYPVLKDVSLHVKKGEFVAVMGPSGSGKTTLLNCISCFIPHDSGNIQIGDIDISSLNEQKLAHARNEKLGFVFQDFMLLDGLTVQENICLPQIIAKKPIAQMTYRFGAVGFLPGIVFACILACVLGMAGRRFINRSDIMEILRTQQKTEMIKEIKPWTFPVGVILTVLGIFLGLGLPQIAARVFGIGLPGIVNLFYLLSLVGIYFILLSAVAQSRTKKNKKKYYGNLISISLMRFTAKATTKNMCVMTLLIFVCIFSSFYGMQYILAGGAVDTENSKEFSLHSPVLENQIGKAEVYDTASSYGIEVTDFTENVGTNLVVSYHAKDFDDNTSRYIEVYRDKEMAALFVSESDFEKLSGQETEVKPGTYLTVTTTDYKVFLNMKMVYRR